MSLAWYVATTHASREVLAATELGQRGIRSFNPQVLSKRVSHGRSFGVPHSYLPGYLFVEFDVVETAWRFINSTRGVKRLLSSGPETPNRIKSGLVEEIMGRCDPEGFVLEPEADEVLIRFSQGDRISVMVGPLAGMKGVVSWSRSDRLRVLFGSTPVLLPAGIVQKVGHA